MIYSPFQPLARDQYDRDALTVRTSKSGRENTPYSVVDACEEKEKLYGKIRIVKYLQSVTLAIVHSPSYTQTTYRYTDTRTHRHGHSQIQNTNRKTTYPPFIYKQSKLVAGTIDRDCLTILMLSILRYSIHLGAVESPDDRPGAPDHFLFFLTGS